MYYGNIFLLPISQKPENQAQEFQRSHLDLVKVIHINEIPQRVL